MKPIALFPGQTAIRVVLLALLIAGVLAVVGWITPAGAQGACERVSGPEAPARVP